jgi:adenine-specific DNA-methyltransferase
LLLTATPLQNSLLELFGLVSFIDEHIFGDLQSFKAQFAGSPEGASLHTLKARLRPICHRTLRRQVTAYVPFTRRYPLVEEFTPGESEDQLYQLVSEYLQRPNLYALPASQRTLITLVLRKLLASSTFAIAGALQTMSERLKSSLQRRAAVEGLGEALEQEYEGLTATAEEWPEGEPEPPLSVENRQGIQREIADLEGFAALAAFIDHNAKGKALLGALAVALQKTKELGGAERAIIFTESRRTQDYLLRLLADGPYADGIVLFNGTNTDERSRAIYHQWLDRHRGSEKVTGSRTADTRSALVDYFREQGQIMIATEAGAEGINLQFCSLVVNYDLPWNPQRIEQRIGRCHRYGQQHDVVVLNFINRKNEADRRVFELLAEKFHLFEGVFGASDDVLGAIEAGVALEKRIAAIYQSCRRSEEIKAAFDQLQLELSLEISTSMARTREQLLEHFDDEVREKLRIRDAESKDQLGRHERMLMQLTRHELAEHAAFLDEGTFRLLSYPLDEPCAAIPLGLYELPRRTGEAHLYRRNHPLAEALVARALRRPLPDAEIRFDYGGYDGRISVLEPLVGASGWLTVTRFSIEALDQGEDHLVVSGIRDDGTILEGEVAARLFALPGQVVGPADAGPIEPRLRELAASLTASIQHNVSERNIRFVHAEAEKLDGWAEDLKAGVEREIKDLDRQIREARRRAASALSLEEKLAAQREIRAMEGQRNQKRRSLFETQDQVDRDRDRLIEQIEQKLRQTTFREILFSLRWVLGDASG